jgi:hypothetical protein
MIPLRAEGFSRSLDVLYGGLGIGKLQFLVKKSIKFFFSSKFSQIFGYQNRESGLDPDLDL